MGRRVGFARWRSDVASGGNRYDDALAAGLRELGLDLREYDVTGAWPFPDARDLERLAEALTAEDEWLIDNIVASGAPEAIRGATAAGRRVAILLHYFPADDPSLSPADRARAAAAEAAALTAATTILVTSEWAAAEVARRYGRDAIAAVPGVDPAELSPGSSRSGPAPMLLWLARLTRTKDPLTFVEALIRLQEIQWTTAIVGPDALDEELTLAVRDRIARAGLADRVQVAGARAGGDLESVWARTDLLVHTSLFESYGMVVTEALARGIPSIVPSGTGAVEAQHGVGSTFPPGEADALAEALRAWLTDSQRRDRWRADAAEARTRLPTWGDAARIVLSALTG